MHFPPSSTFHLPSLQFVRKILPRPRGRCVNLRHLKPTGSCKVEPAQNQGQKHTAHHVFLSNLFSLIPSSGQALGSSDLINGGGESQVKPVFLSRFGTRPRLLQEWLARSVVPEPNRFLLPEFTLHRFFHEMFRQQRASINQRFWARNKCQSSDPMGSHCVPRAGSAAAAPGSVAPSKNSQ